MATIEILKQNELVGLDRDNLEDLYGQLGPDGAENIVCRAMEELAFRLSNLRDLHRDGRLPEMVKISRSLIGIAEQIGLTTLARVARDVSDCAATGDPIAVAATLERLERVGDHSLMAIWDLKDMSI